VRALPTGFVVIAADHSTLSVLAAIRVADDATPIDPHWITVGPTTRTSFSATTIGTTAEIASAPDSQPGLLLTDLDASGALSSPAPALTAAATGVDIARLGHSELVMWSDSTIHAARITNAVVEAPVDIASVGSTRVTVAAGGFGESLLVWSEYDGRAGMFATRLRVRRACSP
jgi:hypothetical protein